MPVGGTKVREGCSTIPQEEKQHHNVPRDVDEEGETSRAKEHDPYAPPERIAMRGCNQPLISRG